MPELNVQHNEENNMYKFQTRVRYSECNQKQEASLTALLDYLQDCCTFQSEYLGIGLEYLEEHQVAWILSSWQVDVLRYPSLGEDLDIFTWPYEIRGFYGLRNFKIVDGSGETILKANSIWVCMDLKDGKPTRPLDKMIEKYPPEEKLDMEYLGRKLPRLQPGEKKQPLPVPHYFIDTNHHVNNAKYILMGEEHLPEGFEVSRIWAEYKKAAKLGDVIVPYVDIQEDAVSIRLCDGEEAAYANMIFYR
jgi:acyl-ACP thioesterase